MFQKKFVEKNEIHFMLNTFFFFENLTVYEIMWKYIVKPGSLQMTIWRERIACWIPKATNTHSQYVIRFAFPRQNGCKIAPQCYVILTLPVLLLLTRTSLNVHLIESKLCYVMLCYVMLNVMLCYIL